MDQLERGPGIQPRLAERVTTALNRAETTEEAALVSELEAVASALQENAAMIEAGDQLGDGGVDQLGDLAQVLPLERALQVAPAASACSQRPSGTLRRPCTDHPGGPQ